MNNLYLIGLMGAGKSSIGRALAKKVHRRHVDTDAVIEKEMGMSVKDIFETLGEEAFRKKETEVIRELSRRRNRIVSTGGGAVLGEENIALMKKSGTVILLKRSPDLILTGTRIHLRPILADDPTKIYKIAEERDHLYESACDFSVVNEGNKSATVEEILKKL